MNEFIVMVAMVKNGPLVQTFAGRKEYLSGSHSIYYHHASSPREVVELFNKDGIDGDRIYFADAETRVRYYRQCDQPA